MLASFISLRAVGGQLMSTSRPMASAGQQMIRPRPCGLATGNRHGCPFVGSSSLNAEEKADKD